MDSNSLGITPEEAWELIKSYQSRPEDFYREVLGADPWDIQVQILRSVWDNRLTTVRSCNGSGKSWNAARIAITYLITHPGGLVLTTAPTWRQVKDILWRELNTALEQSIYPIGGDPAQVGLNLASDWYAVGLSTTDSQKFHGYHSDHILVVVDEAAGVEEPIFEGVQAVTTTANARILYIGNPTALSGTFYQSHRNPLANRIRISAFDTPNFTVNGIHTIEDLVEAIESKRELLTANAKLVSPVWVYERLQEWGSDSPLWQARVMGEFPEQGEDTLIPLNLIEQSMDPEYRKEHNWPVREGRNEYGVDVARFGSDRTVIAPRHGGFFEPLQVFKKLDTMATAGRVHHLINPQDPMTGVYVDDIGVGGGVVDRLREIKGEPGSNERYALAAINVGVQSSQPDKFINLRAELYWNLREMFYNHEIALPNDPELLSELAQIKYAFDSRGRIKIESKEDIKKRTLKSPDKADAVMLAVAGPQYNYGGAMPDEQDLDLEREPSITSGLLDATF